MLRSKEIGVIGIDTGRLVIIDPLHLGDVDYDEIEKNEPYVKGKWGIELSNK